MSQPSYITITIHTENDAFTGEQLGTELQRILSNLADQLLDATITPGDRYPIYDLNGNRVGVVNVHGHNAADEDDED